ncbi:hypothetical protein LSCM1_04894 [Leishmania martiniquensis]|uniref:Uncharacterized protein n=1 Tax=Leishmania martiniquensis TaxID=1580590 RepID=A0A836HBZ2_9TRYP|nr:hypothetical protein LSCM1_04894 [Leishmania martiniquensis]
MRGQLAPLLLPSGAPERLCHVHSISRRCIGSTLQWRRCCQVASDSEGAGLQRSYTQRKGALTIALHTARRRVLTPSSPPPRAANLGTGGTSDSGRIHTNLHSGILCVDALATPQLSVPMRSGSLRARRCFSHRRRRHGSATPGEPSTESIETAAALNASDAGTPCVSSNATSMHPAPPCASPSLHTGTSDTHSAMSPVQERLCQLIGTGAWHEALEVLRCHEQEDAIAARRAQASSASGLCLRRAGALMASTGAGECLTAPPIFVSLHEASVWLLLWCGYGTAAWYAWGRSMQAVSSQPSPRLALSLTLFAHIVERDAMRARDMLLFLEMMRGGAAPSSSEAESGHTQEGNPASPSRMWQHLLRQWLWCCSECTTSSKSPSRAHRRTLASFLEGAVENLERCAFASSATLAGQRTDSMAEAVALLLLGLRDVHGTCGKWHHMLKEELATVCEGKRVQSSGNGDGSASAPRLARSAESSPLAFTPVRALIGEAVQSVLWRTPSTTDDLGRNDGERVDQQCHARLRTIFSNAQHNLQRLRGDCSAAVPMDDGAALGAFRVLHTGLVESEGLGDTWAALRSALRSPPVPPPPFSLSRPTAPDSAAAISPVLRRRIKSATARGDWPAALRLCFGDGLRDGLPSEEGRNSSDVVTQNVTSETVKNRSCLRLSTPAEAPVDCFGLLDRLREGLAACEAARPTGVSWQGALTLWNFIRQCDHLHSECSSLPGTTLTAEETDEPLCTTPLSRGRAPLFLSLSRALGRIFFLLASAGRWAEALACFHDTPDAYLDGFMVSQVAHALRCCPSQNRAVLDLWAAWRCRVGDAVDPTESMTHKLLVAMLQTPAVTSSPVSSLSSSSQSPAIVAARVATAVLVAAAETPSSTPATPVTDVPHATVAPGTAVPLDWQRRRHLVRSIVSDRWVGGWADALRVALASCDVPLLVHTVLRRVPAAHLPELFSHVTRTFQAKGIGLSAADRAAVLSLWCERKKWRPGSGTGGKAESSVSFTAAAVATDSEGGGARQDARNTESFLDELLGLD